MMKCRIIVLAGLLLVWQVALLATSLLDDAGDWHASGEGTWNIEKGRIHMIRPTSAGKPLSLSVRKEVRGDQFYVLSGKYRGANAAASAKVSMVVRTATGQWVIQYNTAELKGQSGPEWQDFRIAACLPASVGNATVVLECLSGAVEFQPLNLQQTTWRDGRAAAAPKLEYWINMDYFDNVAYCSNLKLAGYGEHEIAEFFRKCKQAGVTGVQWRISIFGQVGYHSRGAATVFPGQMPVDKLSPQYRRLAETLKQIDPLAIAVREAKKQGIELYIWMTLSDEGYKHESIPNYCFPDFLVQNPECMLQNRQGKGLPGTLCYSEPKAREYRLNMVRELLAYGADGLYLCTRSHSSVFGVDSGDDYGFNSAVVNAYRQRYGVDIRKDDFDIVKWRAIRSEGFDQLIAEISALAKKSGQKVRLGVASMTLANGALYSNWGKMPLHWQKFLQEGWIDSILNGQNHVGPFLASRENNRFREVASSDQKLYFWGQMVDYRARRVFPLEYLLRQAEFFAFLGANGGVYHEALNMEEAPDRYLLPLGKFYREFAK